MRFVDGERTRIGAWIFLAIVSTASAAPVPPSRSPNQPPTQPTNVNAERTSAVRVTIKWNPSSDPDRQAVTYEVRRNGQPIATTSQTNFTDDAASPDSSIVYSIVAVDSAGLRSTEGTAPNLEAIAVPGRVIARFAGSSPVSLRAIGGSSLSIQPLLNSVAVRAARAGGSAPNVAVVSFDRSRANVSQVINELKKRSDVAYAEPDYIARAVEAPVIPTDPDFFRLWGLNNTGQTGGRADADIDGPEAWAVARDASSVVVAVIDTGIDYRHPDLAANMWRNPGEFGKRAGIDDDGNGIVDDIHGADFLHSDGDPLDGNSHGTHVAGTIGAVGNNGVGVAGICWNVKLMAVQFLSAGGTGSFSDAIRAIDYAVAKGARVLNNSWGAAFFSQGVQDAITAAHNAGVVVVAAAGNSSSSVPFYPAAGSHVIAVSATDHNDELAPFSNFGGHIDIAAPGVSIYSTMIGGRYGFFNGTSMASPHVAGAAALLISKFPSDDPDQIEQRLFQNADDVPSGPPGRDDRFGHGRLNVAASLSTSNPDLIARIISPAKDTVVTQKVSIIGTAAGSLFSRYLLEWGAGTSPVVWNEFKRSSTPIIRDVLGEFDPSQLDDKPYTVRLTVFSSTASLSDQITLIYSNNVAITDPALQTNLALLPSVKAGADIHISGRADGVSFRRFDVEWARGQNPASGWSREGISLAGGGGSRVPGGTLARWTTPAAVADYYTIRLTVAYDAHQVSTSTLVYLDPALYSGNWPRYLPAKRSEENINGVALPASRFTPVLSENGIASLKFSGQIQSEVPSARKYFVYSFSPDGAAGPLIELHAGSNHQTAASRWTSALREDYFVNDHFRGIYRIDANGQRDLFSFAYPESRSHQSPAVVQDMDGDSRPELLSAATAWDGTQNLLQIHVWKSDKTQLSPKYPVSVEYGFQGTPQFIAADVDRDRKSELLVAEDFSTWEGYVRFRVRAFDWNGLPRTSWNSPDIEGVCQFLAAADLDKDGFLEVITLYKTFYGDPVIAVFDRFGKMKKGWPYEFRPSYSSRAWMPPHIAIGDLDNDGFEEIVFSQDETLLVLRADGKLFSPAWPRRDPLVAIGVPVIADVDQDHRPDIIVTRGPQPWPGHGVLGSTGEMPPRTSHHRLPGVSELTVFDRNAQVVKSWRLSGAQGQYSYVFSAAPLVQDLDADGKLEISLIYPLHKDTGGYWDEGGSLAMVFKTGSSASTDTSEWPAAYRDSRNTAVKPSPAPLTFEPNRWAQWNPALTFTQTHTGDFNGDRRSDIVSLSLEGGDWFVGLSTGSTFATSRWLTWNRLIDTEGTRVDDFDGDGLDDLCWQDDENGNWIVARSTGTKFVTSVWAQWKARTFSNVLTGDFNRDGKADIAGFTATDGKWYVGLSNGQQFITSLWTQWNSGIVWVDVITGDFNKDGRTDIAGRSAVSGDWWVALSDGAKFTNARWAQWNPQAAWTSVRSADFNGDGYADIVGRTYQSNVWWVGIASGNAFVTTSWANWNPGLTIFSGNAANPNGDNRSDVIGRATLDGRWWIGASKGDKFETYAGAVWDSNAVWEDVLTGDFNADGFSDVAGRKKSTAEWVVGLGQPSPSGAAPTQVASISETAAPVLSNTVNTARIFPNPYRPSRSPGVTFDRLPAGTEVRIYTILGELIAELHAASNGEAPWNGKNLDGQDVASGVYLVRLKNGNEHATRKVAIER